LITQRPTLTRNSPQVSEEKVKAFFDSEVRPALDSYETRNRSSVDRVVERISQGVDEFKKGIKPFIEDITSWGTRYDVICRLGNDLGEKCWGNPANATEVNRYVSGKIEKHLFSDAELNDLVTRSLKQFRDDITASQNKLHADVRAAWEKNGLDANELDLSGVIQQVNAYTSKIATDSVLVGVLSFVAGFALEEATEALVNNIIKRVINYIATSAATTTAASGGATATAVAAGGSGGTVLGGPIGTVIGVTTALLVGVFADWWMTNKLEEKLTSECNQMIVDIKSQILVGTSQTPGLKHVFVESIRILNAAEEAAIRASLQKEAQ
jgi:hypothetical protein